MAAKPLAVIDTSVLILLLTGDEDDEPGDNDTRLRRMAVRDEIAELQKTHQFAIPSLVVAELAREGDARKPLRRLAGLLKDQTILAFGYGGGVEASKILCDAIKDREPGRERSAAKIDVLICATAIEHRAACIVTENPRDFRAPLSESGSSIKLVVPSEKTEDESGQVLAFRKPADAKK